MELTESKLLVGIRVYCFKAQATDSVVLHNSITSIKFKPSSQNNKYTATKKST